MGLEDGTFLGPYFESAFAILDGLTLLQQCLVGLEAQSLGGYGKYIILLKGVDGDVGRETWLQLQIHVGSRDYYLVSDNVTLCGSLLTNLCDSTLEGVFWESINGEGDALTFFHTTDISFVDVSNHTHVCQVLGDGEQFRGVEGCGNRLTFFH